MASRSVQNQAAATESGHPLRQVTSAEATIDDEATADPQAAGQEQEQVEVEGEGEEGNLEEDDDDAPLEPDFITTHVLDQVAGHPAAGLGATLTLISQKSRPSYTGVTAAGSGRISNWTPTTPTTAPMDQVLPILAVIKSQSPPGWRSVWSLRFEVEEYWRAQKEVGEGDESGKGKGKGKEGEGAAPPPTTRVGDVSFYPEVEIKFFVDPEDPRRHWHVPVLLGPYGYTTYRGS